MKYGKQRRKIPKQSKINCAISWERAQFLDLFEAYTVVMLDSFVFVCYNLNSIDVTRNGRRT